MSLLPFVALLPYVLGVQRVRPAACYQPLPHDSIRLLRIHQGSLNSPIICSFEEGSRYTAVSYVWGDQDDTLPIRVSGHTIYVTRNCVAVLRQLRKDNKSTLYWIDAICINQKSKSEKTVQVRRMRETFAQASHVICWLGEEQSTDRKGIQQLMAKHRRIRDSDRQNWETGGPELWSIYTRPWFRRV